MANGKKKNTICEQIITMTEKLGKRKLTPEEKAKIISKCLLGYYNDNKCTGTIFEIGDNLQNTICILTDTHGVLLAILSLQFP